MNILHIITLYNRCFFQLFTCFALADSIYLKIVTLGLLNRTQCSSSTLTLASLSSLSFLSDNTDTALDNDALRRIL
jgi:hypothetical protein